MSSSKSNNDMWEFVNLANDVAEGAVKADRLQDDRLGKRIKMLTSTSERSHEYAFHSLQMILFVFGQSDLVPEALYDDITKDGERLDRIVIELKVAKEFPRFEMSKDPVVLQRKYMKTKQEWNKNVFRAIRAAKVSTDSQKAAYTAIQLIAAQRSLEEEKKSTNDMLDEMMS